MATSIHTKSGLNYNIKTTVWAGRTLKVKIHD